MRKRDQEKSFEFGNAAKTISFEKHVLDKLERKARLEGTTVSKLVNAMVRYNVSDVEYYRFMAKQYYLKWKEMSYMVEQCEAVVETR